MRSIYRGGLIALVLVLGCVSGASAGPVITYDAEYRDGNTCPTNDDMTNDDDLTVQYKVDAAIECMYITNVSNGAGNTDNPVGTTEEADAFLNSIAAGLAGWGPVDFVGLNSTDGGIPGFSFESLNGGTNGSFEIGLPLTNLYNQFAVAVKDGGDPKFAIFLLPISVFLSDWSFEAPNGSISHFALFGRMNDLCPDGSIPNPGCQFSTSEAPEPASMLMLGTGLMWGAAKVRKRIRTVKDAQKQ
jgi:hypothetical protein